MNSRETATLLENTLTAILPLMSRKEAEAFAGLAAEAVPVSFGLAVLRGISRAG